MQVDSTGYTLAPVALNTAAQVREAAARVRAFRAESRKPKASPVPQPIVPQPSLLEMVKWPEWVTDWSETASNVIKGAFPVSRPSVVFFEYPPAQDILDEVSAFYNVSIVDIKSIRRSDYIIRPRHVCMYLMCELTLLTLPMIAKFLGSKDHTGPLYARNKIREQIKTNPRLVDEIDLLKIKISERMGRKNADLAAAMESA